MATDATGTPTTLGIPKFNTAVDSPSGLGGNAQMDAIDALIAARSLKPDAPSGVKVWNNSTGEWDDPSGTADGTKFLRDDGSWQIASAALVPATTLPGSPTNGQQAILTDSTTAPTYNWLFQYDTTISDSNKWRFVGGVAATVTGGGGTISSASYTDWSSNASFTAPRAGIYKITTGAAIYPSAASASLYASFKVGSGVTQDGNAATRQNGAVNEVTSVSRPSLVSGVAASDVLKTQGRADTGNIISQYVFLEVVPIRVA